MQSLLQVVAFRPLVVDLSQYFGSVLHLAKGTWLFPLKLPPCNPRKLVLSWPQTLTLLPSANSFRERRLEVIGGSLFLLRQMLQTGVPDCLTSWSSRFSVYDWLGAKKDGEKMGASMNGKSVKWVSRKVCLRGIIFDHISHANQWF